MQRHIHHELGLADVSVAVVLPDYRCRYSHDGVVERECCPVAVGVIEEAPVPSPDEVNAIRWIPEEDFLTEIETPNGYSVWCIEGAQLLVANPESPSFLHRLNDL